MSKQSFMEMIKELDWVEELKQAGLEEGIEKGREEGRREILDLSAKVIKELYKKTPLEDIATLYNISVQEVNQIQDLFTLVTA